jgi:SAM-dependent methyltransferase
MRVRGPATPRPGASPATASGDAVIAEFTHQADAFARADVYRLAATLDRLLQALPLGPGDRWLDVACGPGIVARALAARVREAVGIDLTPAMVQRAQADAATVANVRFAVGDAAALPFAPGEFDGAVTRFALHHIPAPARVLREMARVVRPGGHVAAADHLTSAAAAIAAWHHDIERLRDPSHWLSLPGEVFFGLGEAAGLRLVRREEAGFDLDFEEWLARGSDGPAHRALIAECLAHAPTGADEFFAVRAGRLHLRLGIAVWEKPAEAAGNRP